MFGWILHVVEASGYTGLFFLMVAENIFPPIPSEVIIPLSGYAAAEGQMHIGLVILVASLGSLAGALPWYFLGRIFGLARLKHLSLRYGRLLTLSPDHIDRAEGWFNRHGPKAVLFGRMIPAVRTLISVPAGLARMHFLTFLAYSFIGSALWTSLLASLGFLLQSQYDKVAVYLNPASDIIFVLIIGVYIYRVATFKSQR